MSLTSREPLAIRGAIVAAATAIVHVGVVLGLLHLDASAEVAIGTAIDVVGTAVLVVWTRGAVTPVADPVLDPRAAEIAVENYYEPKHSAE
jgi:hypothetical protein